ncbi:hypothetical protein Taro_024102 [Colocasia esculenta]|uniref:Uncharacterized protein n=1 Tax=Colocasia esculenta TaxID=4460 RepID=A0A843VCR1_COLES|nr:hypothetical protein [Colocasia esculenta]
MHHLNVGHVRHSRYNRHEEMKGCLDSMAEGAEQVACLVSQACCSVVEPAVRCLVLGGMTCVYSATACFRVCSVGHAGAEQNERRPETRPRELGGAQTLRSPPGVFGTIFEETWCPVEGAMFAWGASTGPWWAVMGLGTKSFADIKLEKEEIQIVKLTQLSSSKSSFASVNDAYIRTWEGL